MVVGTDKGPAVGRSYQLPRGPRVRLRMVQPRDAGAIAAFMEQAGLSVDELELARLLRFDPRCRAVICASALIDGRERIVAVGAIDLDAQTPDMVLADQDQAEDLRELLSTALCSRAHSRAA